MRARAAAIARDVRAFLESRLGRHPRATDGAASAGWCLAASAFLARRLEESGIEAQVVHGQIHVHGDSAGGPSGRPHAVVRCPGLGLWIDITGDQFGHSAVRLLDAPEAGAAGPAGEALLILDEAELRDLLGAEEDVLAACEVEWPGRRTG